MDALRGVIGYLRLDPLGFGIMAPITSQGTALEENRGSDARAIIDRKPLNIENGALRQLKPTEGYSLPQLTRRGQTCNAVCLGRRFGD
jgi:hypothetical protein